jgi:hypothetical protein
MWLHRVAPDDSDVLPRGLGNTGNDPGNAWPMLGHDPLMERLVRALLPEEEARRMLHGFYSDALHAAISPSAGGWCENVELEQAIGFV